MDGMNRPASGPLELVRGEQSEFANVDLVPHLADHVGIIAQPVVERAPAVERDMGGRTDHFAVRIEDRAAAEESALGRHDFQAGEMGLAMGEAAIECFRIGEVGGGDDKVHMRAFEVWAE